MRPGKSGKLEGLQRGYVGDNNSYSSVGFIPQSCRLGKPGSSLRLQLSDYTRHLDDYLEYIQCGPGSVSCL